MLYFIRSGQYVKIGVSARPWARLAEFQTANPEPLEMLAIGPGDFGFESELHRLFGEHRGAGEWFHDNERIRAVVAFMRDTFPELQSQPRIKSEPVVEYQETAGEPEIRSSWLEFRSVYTKLDGTRRYYGRYRGWIKVDGQWRKKYVSAAPISPMNEGEYQEYKRTGKLPTVQPAGVVVLPPAPPSPAGDAAKENE